MISEVDIMEQQTGVVYTRENDLRHTQIAPGGNLQPVAFSWTATGEDVQTKPDNQPNIPRDVLPYLMLSRTTGAELADCHNMLVVIVSDIASDALLTGYRTAFHSMNIVRTQFSTAHVHRTTLLDAHSTTRQAERLREVSGLTMERLAEIFFVSRMTYHKWLRGYLLNDAHREHLLEILPLMEEAAHRLGSPQAVSNWLLTPVSPGGKKPVDYLQEKRYAMFRGFLLRARTGKEKFHPLPLSNRVHRERPREEFEDALEQLRPRAWINEEDDINDKAE